MANQEWEDVLTNVDWNLLAEQKRTLVELVFSQEQPSQHLSGIIELLDALQDVAEEKGFWKPSQPD